MIILKNRKRLEPVYLPYFADTDDYFSLEDIGWVQRENTPRKEYWDTTKGEPYTYGQGRGMRTYDPNPRLDVVEKYRFLLRGKTGTYFEGCFLNKYDTRKDWLGWHSDDDPAIDHTKPICVITFGQQREIQWKEIGSKGIENISSQMLEEGSLFIMPAGMQHTHYHRIPKMSFESNAPRISMTFRALL